MKICDIVQSYSPRSGGVKFYLSNKMKYLSIRQDIQHIMIVPGKKHGIREEKNTKIFDIKSPQIPGSLDYRLLIGKRRIYAIIQQEQPDIIEIDSAYLSSWIAIFAAKKFSIPVVAYYHSDFPRKLSDKLAFVSRILSREAKLIIDAYLRMVYNRTQATVTATYTYETILKQTGIHNVVRIPLGVDTDTFHPRESRARVFSRLHIEETMRLLVYIGRLAKMKNIENLMEMMNFLEDNHDCAYLLIIGDGELRDIVKEKAKKKQHILWLPYIQDRDVLADIYSAADLFVHAGDMETFGLVSLEAQACGTRVVAVRNGGMDKTLEGESPLIMADSPSPLSIASAVEKCLALDEGKEKIQERSRRIHNNFSWNTTFAQMVTLYNQVIQETARR